MQEQECTVSDERRCFECKHDHSLVCSLTSGNLLTLYVVCLSFQVISSYEETEEAKTKHQLIVYM